jgi:biotin synthase
VQPEAVVGLQTAAHDAQLFTAMREGFVGRGQLARHACAWPLQLATLPAHPESVPINALVAVKGTPMQENEAPTGEA